MRALAWVGVVLSFEFLNPSDCRWAEFYGWSTARHHGAGGGRGGGGRWVGGGALIRTLLGGEEVGLVLVFVVVVHGDDVAVGAADFLGYLSGGEALVA
jgi:hypothetical protein